MLQFLRRRWLAATIVVVLLLAGGVLAFYLARGDAEASSEDEAQDAATAEAPPDLEKLREKYTAGVAASCAVIIGSPSVLLAQSM